MSTVWIIVVATGLATIAFKGLAPLLLGARPLPGPVARVADALAPALLAALVVVQTAGDGGELVLDGRVAGVAAAGVTLAVRAPLLVVLASAAAVAAGVHAVM